jgi:pimeloyl-ACP methyl ester carboxylesterase
MKLPTIVFTPPAWGFNGQGDKIIAALKAIDPNLQVHHPLLQGHNGEQLPDNFGKLSTHDFAERLEILLQVKNLKDVILIGHSKGAYLGNRVSRGSQGKRVKAQIQIAPGGMGPAGLRVAWTIMWSWTYIWSIATRKPVYLKRETAKDLIFNGIADASIEKIAAQPASGKVVQEMIYKIMPRPKVPTFVLAAIHDRMHLSNFFKKVWCWCFGAKYYEFDASHGGILENQKAIQQIVEIVKSFAVHTDTVGV